MNVRTSKRWIFSLGPIALALVLGACNAVVDQGGEVDAELTAQEIALLPAPEQEAETELLAAADNEPVADDAALFDDDQAVEADDVLVDDETDAWRTQALSETAIAAGEAATPQPARLQTSTPPVATPEAALLKWGMHPRASDAMRSIGISASRIMQTIGNAAASAGTHAQDGVVNGHPYCAATDISVSGLTNTQIRNLLEKLGRVGFAAWYRWPGHDGWPSYDVRHIHAVYANARMKSSLRSQVRSWLVGRNGLVSNTLYGFYHWSSAAKAVVRHKFAQSASGTTNAGSSCVVGGLYCGGDKVSGSTSTLYRCTGTGAPSVVRHCANGCRVNSGANDSCR
ncbi:MAG: hypothetical protein JWM53_4345 [bacterium]|nr:hypothetical protein [bacterium]